MSWEDEEAVAREVEQLRREHPGWSIWNHRRSGHPAGIFNAQPKDADTPKLAAAAANELRAAITAVEEGTAGEPSREDQVEALAALKRDRLLGMAVLPMLETPRPYLAVYMYEVYSERVFMENKDGAWSYVWAGGHSTHPVGDPVGAARRVAAALTRRRRQTQDGL